MSFFIYMLASERNGTLYVGMTDDLVKRVWQHRTDALPGFTRKYNVKTLVWHETHESRESAFARERQIKKWNRSWKIKLIEESNPDWRDLWDEIASPIPAASPSPARPRGTSTAAHPRGSGDPIFAKQPTLPSPPLDSRFRGNER
jgi:putative endonuclease